jgi:hypothetical protein
MATKDELKQQILDINPGAQVEDLSHADLSVMLKELSPESADESKPKKAKKKPPYSVPAGKSVTSKRGILSDCEVKAEDFEGEQETLDSLVKSGHVVKA